MRKTPQEYASLIRERCPLVPEVALILGSGLGDLGEQIENAVAVDYGALPGFPVSTAPGHKGRFLLGTLGGKAVVCMQGRLHFYEGHSMEDVILPVRVMRLLGAKTLIATNAAGGINTSFSVGDIMLIEDHINFMGKNPLVGANDETLGCRFPDMSFAYSPELRALAERCAGEIGTQLCKGVYLACSGPSYETPAEIRAFRTLGADAVGMSTVPEAIVARHAGMRVFALSTITNMAAGVSKTPLTHAEVIETGKRVEAQFTEFLASLIAAI